MHLASDVPRAVVAARLRAGTWTKVGHGTYLPVECDAPWRSTPAAPARTLAADQGTAPVRPRSQQDGPRLSRHQVQADAGGAALDRRTVALAQIAGTARRLRAPVVFSHVSAALLWGLPLWRTPRQVHVLQQSTASARSDAAVVRHTMLVDDEDVRLVAGLRVTSLERTLVDCAALLEPIAGLVVADAALAAGADPGDVDRRVHAARGARHVVRMRAVVAHADAGAESPYESASRFVVLRDGLPRPQTQVRVETRLGAVWSDWGWEEFSLLAEYDGRTKYAGIEQAAFMAEKRRHDALLEAGQRVVRVVADDLRGSELTARLLPLLPRSVQRARRPRPDLH